MQQWRLVLVSDRNQRRRLGELYAEAYRLLHDTVYAGARERAIAHQDDQMQRIIGSSDWLGGHFGEAPLVALFFDRNDPSGASIYPAVWSFMLSARGRGVGTTLTTILGVFRSPEVFELIGAPTDRGWELRAAIPCGYPRGRWGVARRRPAHEVTYVDWWGREPEWSIPAPLWEAGGDG